MSLIVGRGTWDSTTPAEERQKNVPASGTGKLKKENPTQSVKRMSLLVRPTPTELFKVAKECPY
jgi:hypothetical protein